MFDLFINTLYEIANKGYPTVNIVAFEVQMPALLGYLPELNICVNCRERVSLKSISFFVR
ncbi:MAG: DNA repair protein RecO C-terminal domain-containing protein [Planctomycetota bacterium]